MVKLLDLFSGIGGFSLGLERSGMKTIAFCERDEFCQKVLNKHRPDIPKPLICRGDYGFSNRVDRLRSLGNAVVPQIPEEIGKAILSTYA